MDGMKWWKEKLDAALKPRERKKREPSPFGSFNERLMAAGIDVTVLFIVLNRPANVVSAKIYSHLPTESRELLSQSQTLPELLNNAVQTGFASLYIINLFVQLFMIGVFVVACQSWIQTTPGKWIMGLKLTTADRETFPSTWRLIVRFIAYCFSFAPLMAGFLWLNFDPERRAWHDRIAGTRVMTMRPDGWYWAQTKKLFAKLRDKT